MTSEIKKQIVNRFLDGGHLVTKDLLEVLENPEAAQKIHDILEQSNESQDALVLDKFMKDLSAGTALNWNEMDNVVLLSQEKQDSTISDKFVEIANTQPESIVTDNETQSEDSESPKRVRILHSYDEQSEKRGVQDFVKHFRARYERLSEMIKQRAEMSAVLSISRVNSKKDREQVIVIGIVWEKSVTKNGNIMLEIEDPTGRIKVLVNKNKPELFDMANDMCLDEVVGVVGVGADTIIFANSLVQPSVPFAELKKSPNDDYAVFLSDMHVGSQCFLPEPFEKFLKWINGESGTPEQKEMASKVKYVFIGGDIVAGVGIYPSQEEELTIPDIFKQYEEAARLLRQLPKDVELVLCAGNHDAVRLAEPQPKFDKYFAKALWDLPNVTIVSNPGMVNFGATEEFGGFNVLLYHGYSFIYYADKIERLRQAGGVDRADLLMKYLIERRHLAPTHTSAQYIPDPDKDPLIIEEVPDFFISGHIHKASVSTYKNCTMICGSCWESQTPFEAKLGLHPEPGRVPVVNLKNKTSQDFEVLRMRKISPGMEKYFERIEKATRDAYEVAVNARKKGIDPENKPEIPLVKDMAERVEGLVSVAAPQIIGTGVAERIKELEEEYGSLDWRISLIIAEEIANEKFCKFKDKKEAMEIGIRVGFSYHTMGTVSSPLEGFVELKFRKRKDGKEYIAIFFSGPIRSAGGTGASVSVLIADYVRRKMGYAPWDPQPEEVKRYVSELYDYHDRVTNLQYLPSEKEIEFMAKHLPIQVDGDPSEKIEVSQGKDLERVETNCIRNGVCLVMGEGLAQKAPKVWRQLSKWGNEFNLDQWNFIEEFVKLQKEIKAKGGGAKKEEKKEDKDAPKIKPDYTFIKDLVAGRPIFTYPLRPGGFRLRYGRGRTSGYSCNCIHPATMLITNKYLAVGSQLKTERPGKGATVTTCSTIEGPIVLLNNGNVVELNTFQKAKEHQHQIKKILFLGDMLISYGDFFNRAHPLVPAGYCYEWWVQELEKKLKEQGEPSSELLAKQVDIEESIAKEILNNPIVRPSGEVALKISQKLQVPMFPIYTPHVNILSKEKVALLFQSLFRANIIKENDKVVKLIIPNKEEIKSVFEEAGIPHILAQKEFIVIEKDWSTILTAALNLGRSKWEEKNTDTHLELLNSFSSITFRDRSGTFIGARMGRPEKGKQRKLQGSPHGLFPVGEEGGRMRSMKSALDAGKITAEFPIFWSQEHDRETIYPLCEESGNPTKRKFVLPNGAITETEVPNETRTYRRKEIDIRHHFKHAMKMAKLPQPPDLIKGVKGTSNKAHVPEHLVKAILRAKNEVFVNKDGTIRYDMSQLPITHFKPREISAPVEKLRELGYEYDVYGKPLERDDQICEIRPQDIVLPRCETANDEGADQVLKRVGNFIDDLLEYAYDQPRFYNFKKPEDMIGHMMLALAPHTSGAMMTRIIGFSSSQGFFAHPLLHAATRRDCDGDEACVIFLLDAVLNFSKQFLPAHRGATQDAPLVITTHLYPTEVDDMVFDLDIGFRYPLELYESALEYKPPWDIKVPQISNFLGNEKQYEGMGFTHDTFSINEGVLCSNYKLLPSMKEKLDGQMDLADRIHAVDEDDVARLVIEKHFLKDTKGNLRKFSTQEFRCVDCNEKFRRPPLRGKCIKCNGKILFTVAEGSVIKYVQATMDLGEKYNLSPYLDQNLQVLQHMLIEVFGKEKETQTGLASFMGKT